ncbi:MAG: SDR family NAD(P)-dependent oxidoreductase [Bacteroidales bacterium]|nr:SDR family NAD(P)-dependent oxidoreductase [Bacteroidales bacterium]
MASLIITGANGNLGLAVVHRLLKDGYHILAASGHGGAGNLPHHEKLEIREVDLLNEEEARNFAKIVLQCNTDLQAAILLVGGFAMGKLADTGKADLDKMINLNFYTAYHLVRPLLSHFISRPQGGQFILVGSRPGLNAADGKDFFAYSMSKAMIFKLADFINAEGKDKSVTATVIVPSTIDTETNRKSMPGADFSKWVPAENIADAISFSLSDTGRMMRESVIKVYNRS